YAENQAKKERTMTMRDWADKLDAFLGFNEYEILDNPGKVSHEIAQRLAENEYEKFRITQDQSFESDFDRQTKKYLDKAL
ncbi:MAG: RhuM family protein, partial [Candidatus Moraniibacteriota bacterium]